MKETKMPAETHAGFGELNEDEMKECRGGVGWVVSAACPWRLVRKQFWGRS